MNRYLWITLLVALLAIPQFAASQPPDPKYFPHRDLGDTIAASEGIRYFDAPPLQTWRKAGDYAEGTRTSYDYICGLDYHFYYSVINLGGEVANIAVLVNGEVVGSFSVSDGMPRQTFSFSFAPIQGPDYTIRLEQTNTTSYVPSDPNNDGWWIIDYISINEDGPETGELTLYECLEGCTPGFWKNHLGAWVGYDPHDDNYDGVFGVTSSFAATTLLEVLQQGGGGEIALGRHAVAALLNAASGDINYAYTIDKIKTMVQDAYATGDFNGVKDQLEAENERGCDDDLGDNSGGNGKAKNSNGKAKGKNKAAPALSPDSKLATVWGAMKRR